MIGDIIKEQRIYKKMTRKSLAEGICSEKYIYLIERNERNPSAYILNNLSEKLGIDLFEYYQYLNYEDKILVSKHKDRFQRYIQLGDIGKLKEESLKAARLKDFKEEPLIYDITIINLWYQALIKDKTRETIKELNDIFEIKKLNIDNLTLINGYILLSTCYQIEGQLDKAREILEVAYDMVRTKKDFSRYSITIITVMISLTSLLYNEKEYDKLIEYSNELMEFQEKSNEYNRIYYVYFYISFAYYRINKLTKSKKHFMRGIYSALLFRNRLDMSYIVEMKEFNEIVDNLDIDEYLIDEFYEILDKNDDLI